MSTPHAKEVLALYKAILREAQKFPSYNYKKYAVLRIQDAFKSYKTLADEQQITDKINYGRSNLELIRRQTVVGNLYQTHKSIIEQQPKVPKEQKKEEQQ